MLGDVQSPTFGNLAASGGNLQYSVTPTTRSPRPSANKVSVMPGAVETIRRGKPDAACKDDNAAAADAKRSRRLRIISDLLQDLPDRYLRFGRTSHLTSDDEVTGAGSYCFPRSC